VQRRDFHFKVIFFTFAKKITMPFVPASIQIQLLSEAAILPTKATTGAGGYDLFSPVDFVVKPGDRVTIDLDLAIAIPPGVVGMIKSRSSVARNTMCDVVAGVIDSDYRGNVAVMLHNSSKEEVTFVRAQRISQILFVLCWSGDLQVTDSLDATERGSGGFGSTDKRKEEEAPAESQSPKRAKLEFNAE